MNYPYPVMYKNIYKDDEMKQAEHMTVRTSVGWYLWTHQLVEVTGPDCTAFLEYIFPKNIGNLAVGRERYTTMLDEAGEIIDDVVVFRMEEKKFWISTLFRKDMFRWFESHKGSFDVSWTDITPQWEMYAVQGPKSTDMVDTITKIPVNSMKFFEIRANEIDGVPVYVNRAGYTGEKLGFEIYFPKAEAPAMEEKLRALAKTFEGREVTEFQVMAWTLPCEAGFFYMRDLRHTNPFEVGLEGGINWEKDFIGKEALLKVREEGPTREVVGFTVADVDIHIKGRNMGNEGEFVYKDGEYVGRCMKICYSFVKDTNNGTIICRKDSLKPGDKVTMHGHEAVICAPKFI